MKKKTVVPLPIECREIPEASFKHFQTFVQSYEGLRNVQYQKCKFLPLLFCSSEWP